MPGTHPVHLLREEEHGRPVDGHHGEAQQRGSRSAVEYDREKPAHCTSREQRRLSGKERSELLIITVDTFLFPNLTAYTGRMTAEKMRSRTLSEMMKGVVTWRLVLLEEKFYF